MYIVYMVCGWAAGIWLAARHPAGWQTWLALAFAGVFAAGILHRRRHHWPTGWLQPLWVGVLLVIGGGLGAARQAIAEPEIDAGHVAYYNGAGAVVLTGVVIDEPEVLDRQVRLRVRAETLAIDGATVSVDGVVLVQTPPYPVTPYGARVSLNGTLNEPPTDGSFNYAAYLARQGILSVMTWPRREVLAANQGSPLRAALLAVKGRSLAIINRLVPDPAGALLSGILLGVDTGLSDSLAGAFRITGMTHIIAISGFNIAVLAGVLVRLTEPWLGPRRAVWPALAGIGAYTLLVGADASVVRAAIMGGVYLLTGRSLGQAVFAPAVLALAAGVMTLVNPLTLWDVGFQLSFAATLSLILYADPLTQWVRRQLQRRFRTRTTDRILALIAEPVLITVAAQILTLPLMVTTFGQLSLVSLVANALILPAQPGVMLWGGLATIMGLVHPLLGQPLAWIAWLFLTYTIVLVELLARVPLASVDAAAPVWSVLLFYAALLGATAFRRLPADVQAAIGTFVRVQAGRQLVTTAVLALGLLTLAWGVTQPDGRLHVTFIDVGQGDAIFISTPTGRQILVDGGLYPSVLNDAMGRAMPFWDRELDIVVATHPDADHVAGLPGMFTRFRVGTLITDGTPAGVSETYDAVLAEAETGATEIRVARAGATIDMGDGVVLRVVHPAESRSESRNDNSVSLRLTYGNFSLLLTGDAEEEGERQMSASNEPLGALIFKAGHHGSRTSSHDFFLARVRPQIVIVSAAADNRFGHPHPEAVARLEQAGAVVLRTETRGAIRVTTDGYQMWWRAAR